MLNECRPRHALYLTELRMSQPTLTDMDDSSGNVKHFQPIELTNQQRLEISALMDQLREEKVLPNNINLGQFSMLCFLRGFNEYRKDLRSDV